MSDPYERIRWRGHRFDRRTKAAILALEDRLDRRVTIYQGSYSTSVGASAGSHDGGGAVDLWVSGIDANTVTRAARNVGWAMWWRTPRQGDWGNHQHGILRRHSTASSFAKAQASNFDEGGDGLGSLLPGDDPQPYRPDPLVTFDYRAWTKAQNLRSRLRHLARDIAALRDRRRKVRRELARVLTS